MSLFQRSGRGLALVLCLLAPLWAHGAKGKGSSGGILARLPVGARSMGLGGSHGTLPQMPEVLLVNPATLTTFDSFTAEAAYHQGVEDVVYNGLLMVLPVTRWLNVGAAVTSLSAGIIEAYDYAGNRFQADLQEDRLITIGHAAQLGPVSLGISLKYLSSILVGTEKSQVMLGDVGAGFRFGLGGADADADAQAPGSRRNANWMYLGVSVSNLGGSFKYGSNVLVADPPPTQYRLGLAVAKELRARQHVLLALAVDIPRSTARPEARGGLEFSVPTRLFEVQVRSGIRFRRDGGTLSAGLGALFRGIRVDYAFLAANDPFGSSHHFSLGFNLGNFRRSTSPPRGGGTAPAKPAVLE